MGLLVGERAARQPHVHSQLEVLDGALDLRGPLGMGLGLGLQAGPVGVGLAALGVEELAAGVGDGVQLAGAIGGADADPAHLLHQGERGIHHARAGAVAAVHLFFDGLDELVAVARLLGDQPQQHQPQTAMAQHPGPPRATTGAGGQVEVFHTVSLFI